MAFKYAVYKINKDPTIFANKTLTYDIQYVPREDSFRTTNKVKHSNAEIYLYVYILIDMQPSGIRDPGLVWTQ